MWHYREPTFQLWGMLLGLRNLAVNGCRLGLRPTLSQILEPMFAYTRFPEYHFFLAAAERLAAARPAAAPPLHVLDVGSPKTFGLFLASHLRGRFLLTDLDEANLAPYRILRSALPQTAGTEVEFATCDVRRIAAPDAAFDLVYAMSVLEHVEGDGQDRQAMREMFRVLRPGGILVVSVPLVRTAAEQVIRGLVHGGAPAADRDLHFFQRLYDADRVQHDLIAPVAGAAGSVEVTSVSRRPSFALRAYHGYRARMPLPLQGILGILNPVASLAFNRHQSGLQRDPYVRGLSREHSRADIYGDAIVVVQKGPPAAPGTAP